MIRFLRLALLPFSALYSVGVFLRNRLYDLNIVKSKQGALPTIVVGNLSVGGTGKTPHIEFLVNALKENVALAVLSRGYGRKTEGFQLSDEHSTSTQIGDEPHQIKKKFPTLTLAVCEDRLSGIELLKRKTDAKLVLMDDAFQHRKLRGDINILLMDFYSPWWNDFTLPAGMLRDNVMEKRRADIIIVTKCPGKIDSRTIAQFEKSISPSQHQSIYFTRLKYGKPIQIAGESMDATAIKEVVAFSGIARPEHFERQLTQFYELKKFVQFRDHHIFSQLDIKNLVQECGNFASRGIALLTTEKDAVKLMEMTLYIRIPLFYIPIEIEFVSKADSFLMELREKLNVRKL